MDEGQEGTKKKALVMDDDAQVRELVAEILEDEGFEVEKAESGQQGCEILQERSSDFAIVVSDNKMPPGMTGEDIYRELRRSCNKVPFVLMSGDLPSSAQILRELDAYAVYVAKPPNLLEIIGAVQKALKGEGQQLITSQPPSPAGG